MPGFTHLQKAQPVTLAHHVGAYFEMFRRDRSRMADIRKRMNYLSARCRRTCRNHLSAGPMIYTQSCLALTGRQETAWIPYLTGIIVIELLSALSTDHDASEPFLRGDHHLELQRVPFRGDRRCLQHRKQHHAAEEESGYRRACKRKDRPCLWCTDFHPYNHERTFRLPTTKTCRKTRN